MQMLPDNAINDVCFDNNGGIVMTQRGAVLERLNTLGIPYELAEHPAVFTIDEMERLGVPLDGEVVKNLFLRDAKKRRFFLVAVQKDKQVDLRRLGELLGAGRLSFASAELLEQFLGLHQGEVTPMGVLNDRDAKVEVVFDQDLEGHPRLGVHPNENTATLWMSYEDIRRVVEGNGNSFRCVRL